MKLLVRLFILLFIISGLSSGIIYSQTWQQVYKTNLWVERIVFSDRSPGTVFITLDSAPMNITAKTLTFWPKFGFGFKISHNNGVTFDSTLLDGFYILDIFEHPTNDSIIFVSAYKGGLGGIIRSTDKGASWSNDYFGCQGSYALTRIIKSPRTNTSFYASTVLSTGGFVYTDNDFLNCTSDESLTIQSRDIKISTLDTSLIYLAADASYSNGVWHSTDGGTNWLKYESGLNGLRVYTVQPSAYFAGTVFCGADSLSSDGSTSVGCGIYSSNDSGRSWRKVAATNFRVFSILENPYNPKYFAAACDSGGVYVSGNYGAYWTSYNDGLPSGSSVRTIAYPNIKPDSNGAIIYCAVDTFGIYKSVPLTTEVNEYTYNQPDNISIEQIFPQPASDVINIILKNSSVQTVKLDFMDLSGNILSTLIDGEMNIGYKSLNVNTNQIYSGVYLLRMEAGTESIFKKIIIVR